MPRGNRSNAFIVLTMVIVTACGGDEAPAAPQTPPTPPPAVTIAIAPQTAIIIGGAAQQFTATVTNGSTSDVTWTTTGGVLSGTGSSRTFTAPMSGGPFTVTATSVADPSKKATATVTITPAAVTITPATVTIPAGGTQQFTATVVNAANGDVTWSTTGGTLTGTGNTVTLTVPLDVEPITVTATSVADPARKGNAAVTVAASTTELTNAPVPSGGGVVTISAPGSPVTGLTIRVPAGAYPVQTSWNVSALHTVRPTLPDGARLIGPVVRIGNGQAYSERPFTIELPARLGPDSALGAFYYHSASGTFEAIPIVKRTDTSVVLLTRHVDARQIISGTATAAAGKWLTSMFNTPEETEIALLGGDIFKTNVGRETGFNAGIDDWEFPNRGSYIVPRGYSAGASISALYHFFYRRATEGSLHENYDRIPDFEWDNPRGIRLASVIQYVLQQNTDPWDHIADVMAEAASAGKSWVTTQAHALAMAIWLSGRPKLIGVYSDNFDRTMIALAYEYREGAFSVSSTRSPGVANVLTYKDGAWEPFTFGESADDPPEPFETVVMWGNSALVPVRQMQTYWSLFDNETIGDNLFPSLIREYRDPINDKWLPVTDEVLTASESLYVRTRCPSCALKRPEPSHPDRIMTPAYSMTGELINSDIPNDVPGSLLRMPQVNTYSGGFLHTWALPDNMEKAKFIDWTYQDTERVPFGIIRSRIPAIAGQEITYTANNPRLQGTGYRYEWDMGDDTHYSGDVATITHRYKTVGSFQPTLTLLDADDTPLARARVNQFSQEGYHWKMVCAEAKTDNPSPNFSGVQASSYNLWSGYNHHVASTPTDGFLSLLTPSNPRRFGSFFVVTKPGQGATAKALWLYPADTLDSPKLDVRYYLGSAFETPGGPAGYVRSYNGSGVGNYVGAQLITSISFAEHSQGWGRGTLRTNVSGFGPTITLRFYARQIWEENPAPNPPCAFGGGW